MTRRSWLQVALAVALGLSVLANVFMLGFIAKTWRAGLGAGVVAEALVLDYPKEVRTEFRKLLRENRPQAFALVRELRQARRALADAAGATPYVEADVERAIVRLRSVTDELQTMMQGLLIEALRNTRQAA